MMTAPSASPKRTLGRRNSGGRRLLPMIRTSPPGRAEGGITVSICGLPFAFFLPSRSVKAMRSVLSQDPVMRQAHHDDPCVKPGAHVINHDAGAFGQSFQPSQRRWLHDIEPTKKYKAR